MEKETIIEFVPSKGIKCNKIEIYFGDIRDHLRKSLSNKQQKGRWNSEDNYENFNDTKTWFRLHYKNNKLSEIEILEGTLVYKDKPILYENAKSVLKIFTNEGYKFVNKGRDTGWVCEELKVAFNKSSNMGGEGSAISYCYLANDISHLLED
jgi:hypothetical protein